MSEASLARKVPGKRPKVRFVVAKRLPPTFRVTTFEDIADPWSKVVEAVTIGAVKSSLLK